MSDVRFIQLLDLAAGLVLVSAFATLWLRRLVTAVRVLAVQGIALGMVALVVAVHDHDEELVGVALMVTVLRGVVLPLIVLRAVRAGEHREVESIINVPASLLTASGLTLIAYASTRQVVALSATAQVRAVPLGIAVALIGMLLIATRRKAALQMMGVLMLDNGIALVMFLATSGVPVAVELGIATDLVLTMLVLQLLTANVRRHVGSTDLDQLTELRD